MCLSMSLRVNGACLKRRCTERISRETRSLRRSRKHQLSSRVGSLGSTTDRARVGLNVRCTTSCPLLDHLFSILVPESIGGPTLQVCAVQEFMQTLDGQHHTDSAICMHGHEDSKECMEVVSSKQIFWFRTTQR